MISKAGTNKKKQKKEKNWCGFKPTLKIKNIDSFANKFC